MKLKINICNEIILDKVLGMVFPFFLFYSFLFLSICVNWLLFCFFSPSLNFFALIQDIKLWAKCSCLFHSFILNGIWIEWSVVSQEIATAQTLLSTQNHTILTNIPPCCIVCVYLSTVGCLRFFSFAIAIFPLCNVNANANIGPKIIEMAFVCACVVMAFVFAADKNATFPSFS